MQIQPNDWVSSGARRAAPSTRKSVRQRAGFYTRYSTASQYETSTERQIEDCHAYSKRLGFALVEKGIYSDEERSGGFIVKRDRLHALLKRAEAGDLDVVVIADPSRLSRDMVDLGWLWRTLARAGVALHAVNRGPLAAADIALYGFLSQEQRQTVAANTAWGRKRMVADGRVPWGAFYGYRKTGGKGGEIEKDPEQAPIVERIYQLRIQGISLRGIAEALNKDGVGGPGGGIWKTGAVYTILNQPCYAGVIVYGRYKCETNPETGKKKISSRDSGEWVLAQVPQLKIIEPSAWKIAQDTNAKDIGDRRKKMGPKGAYLLSGLVRCAVCGSNMIIRGTKPGSEHQAYVCSLRDSSNGCATKSSVSLVAIERAVFAALSEFLSKPEICLAYLRSVAAEANSRHKHLKQTREALDRKIGSLKDRLHKTFDDSLTAGFSSKTISRIRTDIEEKLTSLEASLEAMPKVRDEIDVGKEAAGFGTLHDALASLRSNGVLDVRNVHGERLAVSIRALIDHVVATPIGETRGVRAVVTLKHPASEHEHEPTKVAEPWEIAGDGYPPTRSEIWRQAGKRQVEHAISSGNCVLDDKTWSLIAHLVPERHCKTLTGDMRSPRALVNMLLLSSRLSRPFSDLPASYGRRWRLRYAVRSLKASGGWKAVCDILSAEAPRFLEGAISHMPRDPVAAAARRRARGRPDL